MRRVYLVRHASPAVRPGVPTREWTLSDRGIDEARALARVAAAWELRAVYCGDEPKMRATALVLAEPSGAPVHAVDAFSESRIGEWIANADEFNELVRTMLMGGDPLPRGVESADEAAARFADGLAMTESGAFPAAVVSGGRSLTSYLSRKRRGIEDVFAFWRAIPFPGWTAIDLDDPNEPVAPFRGGDG
jgi:broad specificity phosphatase PhoE